MGFCRVWKRMLSWLDDATQGNERAVVVARACSRRDAPIAKQLHRREGFVVGFPACVFFIIAEGVIHFLVRGFQHDMQRSRLPLP